MYDRSQFQTARGHAAVQLRRLAASLGERERAILADPQVVCRRWPDHVECIEWRVSDRPELGACVIHRDGRIVG